MIKAIVLSLVFSAISIGCPKNGNAAPLIGQDYYAAQSPSFKIDAATSILARGTPTGNLDTTFSADITKLRKLFTATAPAYHRVHLTNNTCIRNNNCGRYEIGYGYTKESFNKALEKKERKIISYLQARTSTYRALALEFPGTKFLVSPFLEHDLSKLGYRNGADAVASIWPDVQLVNSPDGGIAVERYRSSWVERHGNKPQSDADIVSLDGVGASDIDINAFLSRTTRAKLVYIWERQYNCRTNSETFVDPRKRTACPTPGIFEELIHIAEDRGTVPKFRGKCGTVAAFKEPWIWKPLSENTWNQAPGTRQDVRADKPVAIVSYNNQALEVLDASGAKIGSLGYYGTYGSALRRYYSGWRGGTNINGYGFEKRAKSNTGSGYTWLRAGTKCTGPIIAGRRNGLYR